MYAVIEGLPMILYRSVTVCIGRQEHHIIVIPVSDISQMVEAELVTVCLVQAQHTIDSHQALMSMIAGFVECSFVDFISRISLQIIASGECHGSKKHCRQIDYDLFHVFN